MCYKKRRNFIDWQPGLAYLVPNTLWCNSQHGSSPVYAFPVVCGYWSKAGTTARYYLFAPQVCTSAGNYYLADSPVKSSLSDKRKSDLWPLSALCGQGIVPHCVRRLRQQAIMKWTMPAGRYTCALHILWPIGHRPSGQNWIPTPKSDYRRIKSLKFPVPFASCCWFGQIELHITFRKHTLLQTSYSKFRTRKLLRNKSLRSVSKSI